MEIFNIDMHNHTQGSDGKQLPLRLLLRASKANKNIISMTDHNSVKGYRMLERQIKAIMDKAEDSRYKGTPKMLKLYENVLNVFSQVKLLKGTEIITTYEGNVIEVLGYDIDIDVMEKEIADLRKNVVPSGTVLKKSLLQIVDKYNIKFDKDVYAEGKTGTVTGRFFDEIKKYDENQEFTKNFATLKEFIVKELYNPKSKFFVDLSECHPSMEDVIKSIHKAGGKAVLAHPGRYNFDVKGSMDTMIDKGLDGIEVWYPDHTSEFQSFLMDKVKERGLIASGGSDDHCNTKDGERYTMGKINVPEIPQTEWIKDLAKTGKNFIDESKILREGKGKLAQELETGKLSRERNRFLEVLRVRKSEMINSETQSKTKDKENPREQGER